MSVLLFVALCVALPMFALSALRRYGNPPVRDLSRGDRIVPDSSSYPLTFADVPYFLATPRGWGERGPVTVRDSAGNVIGTIVL